MSNTSVTNEFISVSEPLLGGNEKKYLAQCVDSGWISSEGPFVKEFERRFSSNVGREYGIAVSSGTAALEVAVAALGIGDGDEVIMPTFTIISCAAVVVRAGGVPVLVDCDPLTWNMDVSQIASRITAKTKAIPKRSFIPGQSTRSSIIYILKMLKCTECTPHKKIIKNLRPLKETNELIFHSPEYFANRKFLTHLKMCRHNFIGHVPGEGYIIRVPMQTKIKKEWIDSIR